MRTKKVTNNSIGSSAILIGIALQTFCPLTAHATGGLINPTIALQGVIRATSTTFVPDGSYCADIIITETTNGTAIYTGTYPGFTTSSGAFTINVTLSSAAALDVLASSTDTAKATIKIDYSENTCASPSYTDTFTGIQLFTVPYAAVAGIADNLSSSSTYTLPLANLSTSGITSGQYLQYNGTTYVGASPSVSGVTSSSSAPVIAGTSSTTVGNTTASTTVTVEAGSGGAVDIGTTSASTHIDDSTSGGTGALSMGNTTGATTITGSTVGLNGTTTVTGATSITGTTTINTTGSGTTSIGGGTSTGTISIGNSSGSQGVTIGGSSGTGTIAIGGSTANQPVTIGSTSGTITIGAGGASTGAITIGQGTSTQTTTIGGSTGTGAISIGASSGAQNVTIGSTGAGTVTIGGAAATGTITVGSSTGAQAVKIGAGTGNSVTIGNLGTAFSAGIVQCSLATVVASQTQTVTGCTGIPSAGAGWSCQCSMNNLNGATSTTAPTSVSVNYAKPGYSGTATAAAADVFVELTAAITTAGNNSLNCLCYK